MRYTEGANHRPFQEYDVPKAPARSACNPLCQKCLRHCRQPSAVVLVDCPRFLPLPFKIEKHAYDQLDLFGSPRGDRP